MTTRKLYRSLFLVAVALGLGYATAIYTLFLPVEVPNDEALGRVAMGFPIQFAYQNQHFLTPLNFPIQTRLVSPWESPTAVQVELLGLAGLVWATAWGLLFPILVPVFKWLRLKDAVLQG